MKVRAVAIPYRLRNKSEYKRAYSHFSGIVLDRPRILFGNPDSELPSWCADDLKTWASKQLGNLPQRS